MYSYQDIKQEYRASSDSGDKWGSCMGAFFPLVAELEWRGADIPTEWEYSPPNISGDPREPEDYLYEVYKETDTDNLLRMGAIFHRYSGALCHAGLDY